jgi:Na+-transporting NADH:ubiquinone oxidoreductase subunit C
MKDSLYTLCYAAVLGAVCAFLLTAAASYTAPYKAANEQAEEVLNILSALKVPFDEGASSQELLEVFKTNVRVESADDIELFVYSPKEASGKTEAVVVRFAGPGLWGQVKGFLALESDMRTIRGLTFYHHEETPGLGGEISSEWFRKQFIGKKIVDASGKRGILIRSGAGSAQNQVDAITGATMTCDKVQEMLNNVITDIIGEAE